MKKVNLIVSGIFFILLSAVVNAQTETGFDYFEGKWDVVVSAPNGEREMVVVFEKSEGEVKGKIQDSEGKELYKVTGTEIDEEKANIEFIGSRDDEVSLVLRKKDKDHVTGNVMNMFGAEGERIKKDKK